MDVQEAEVISKVVKKVKKGDKAAFNLLYQKTWKQGFYLLLKKLKSEEDAKIALNEAYVKVYLNINKLDNDMAFVAWFNSILHTTCVDFLRSKNKFTNEAFYDDIENLQELEEIDEDFLPHAAYEKAEAREAIKEVVEQLPETQREAIFMFYYQSLTIKEIANITNVQENTIYKRLHDAKKALKSKLETLAGEGVKLYGMSGFGKLFGKFFEEDLTTHATNAIGDEIWNTLSSNLLIKSTAVGAKQAVMAKLAAGTIAAAVTAFVATSYITPPPQKPIDTVVAIQTSTETPKLQEVEIILETPTPHQQITQTEIPIKPQQTQTPNEIVAEVAPQIEAQMQQAQPTERYETAILQETTPTGLVETPKPEPTETEIAQIETVTEVVTEVLEQAQETKPTENLPQTPKDKNIARQFEMEYEINAVTEKQQLIKDIAAQSGNTFDAATAQITFINDNFNGAEIGSYIVELTAKQPLETVEIKVKINVVDTIAPQIQIANTRLILNSGEQKSLDEILQLAQITIFDNSQKLITPTVKGYELIDFSQKGIYVLEVKAQDEQSNAAPSKNIIIKIN